MSTINYDRFQEVILLEDDLLDLAPQYFLLGDFVPVKKAFG